MSGHGGREHQDTDACGQLDIRVLGPLEVRRDGRPLEIGPAMVRRLLAVLALHPGSVVSREEIAEVLWDGEPPTTHVNLIQVYVSRLRSQLRTSDRPEDDPVVTDRNGYRLKVAPGTVDLSRFDVLRARADQNLQDGDSAAACTDYEAALRCWRGPLLADLGSAATTLPSVVAAEERRIGAAVQYARLCTAAGRPDPAVHPLRDVARSTPLHEGVHAALMHTLAAAGDRAGALVVYDQLRRRLSDELGVHPGPDLQAAHLGLLRAPELAPRRKRNGPQNDAPVRVPREQPAPEQVPAEPVTAPSQDLAWYRSTREVAVLASAATAVLVVACLTAFWAMQHPRAAEADPPSAATEVASGEDRKLEEPIFRTNRHWDEAYGPALGSTPTADQWATAYLTDFTDPDTCAGFRFRVGTDPRGKGDNQGVFLLACPTKWQIMGQPVDRKRGDVETLPPEGLLQVMLTEEGLATINYADRPLIAMKLRGVYPWSRIVPGIYQGEGRVVMSRIRSNAS